MVGRRRELAMVRAWLDAARHGGGRLVLCEGEPGIGKTRLAQEIAGVALAGGTAVAWGRCIEAAGAPAFWPWRQVLDALGIEPDPVLAADAESPQERFRVLDGVTAAVCDACPGGLVVILDDLHRADEPSLLVLRHLADRLVDTRLLVFAAFRSGEPVGVLPRLLPELVRSPAVERLVLHGFDVEEVREQLSRAGAHDPDAHARAVFDTTGGNPLFVQEVARAIADGTWRADRPPRTVLDVVSARLDRISDPCRHLVQAAAVVGRDFSLALVAATLVQPVARCVPLVDEATAHGLIDRVGPGGDYRFVHALTRDAVEASLATAERDVLHRAVAEALAQHHAGDLADHLAEIARHWAALVPYGEGATARAWAIRAADQAVRALAYEEAVRLYQAALTLEAASLPELERWRVLVALGRASYFAGDLDTCARAAVAAAEVARAASRPDLEAEAALVVEAAPDPRVNAVAEQLCESALAALGASGHDALRARLLAQRSHLAFYDGEQERVASLSAAALDLARASGDDRALGDALHARKEACPGPAGRAERLELATEMLALARRTSSARTTMWGELWRVEALAEGGRIADAADALPTLQIAVERVGGPVSAWHLDRARACIAQAQGQYAEAAAIARRGFDRMRVIEPAPAAGAYFALQTALATHVAATDDARRFAMEPFEPPPRFRTMARLSRAFLRLRLGLVDEAAASYQQAGPLHTWSLPAFFVLPGYVYGALAAAELGRHDDLAELLRRLEPFRGEHAIGDVVAYMGPVELTLGRGAVALGRLDDGVDALVVAADQADRAGAPGFVAEARYHLAVALLSRDQPGDRDRAEQAARDADRLVRELGMTAYTDRARALVVQVASGRPAALSPREVEVAQLVAVGLTNRQIAERLVISERTAQNHVQHILTKLGFTSRSQIAAWSVRAGG
jgi:DNA-binding CsgD family transcriptional regulator